MKMEPNLIYKFKSLKLSLICNTGKLSNDSVKINKNTDELKRWDKACILSPSLTFSALTILFLILMKHSAPPFIHLCC